LGYWVIKVSNVKIESCRNVEIEVGLIYKGTLCLRLIPMHSITYLPTNLITYFHGCISDIKNVIGLLGYWVIKVSNVKIESCRNVEIEVGLIYKGTLCLRLIPMHSITYLPTNLITYFHGCISDIKNVIGLLGYAEGPPAEGIPYGSKVSDVTVFEFRSWFRI